MKRLILIQTQIAVAAFTLTFSSPPLSARADEGMWLFNQPPRKLLKDRHGFEVTDAWLEHVQKSSVRFNSGGSGEFVSPEGLVLSNHHVGADALQKFGDKDHNYMRDGFYARTHAEEKRCLDLELNVLMSIEDVTDRVNAAVKPGLTAEAAFAARRAAMAAIEKESMDKSGLRSDVVTLYQGGQYHLYRFKKYTDVRLVFAPEQQAAFYGGDPDNFEYPRFDLDICLFRVYENDKPAKIDHYLKWSRKGVSENELVFVSGHPGRTSRLFTVPEFEYLRDYMYPRRLHYHQRREVVMTAFSQRSEENARIAREDLFGAQNSRKALNGELAGILDPAFIESQKAKEHKFRQAMLAREDLKDSAGALDKIAAAQKIIQQNATHYNMIEGAQGLNSRLFGIARTILRAADEKSKPNGDRLREYRDSNLPSLEFALFSEEPIYDDYEILLLADSFMWLAEHLGAANPLVQKVLAGKSPRDRASELIHGTSLKKVAQREALYKGGTSAIATAKDPMIELARLVDSDARAVRKIIETQTEVKQQAHFQLAKARFLLEGTSNYPDATFTLRLAFGLVKGFEEDGQHIPFQTTIAGLYQRSTEHKNQPPFDIPQRWIDRKSKLDLSTPMNFVCTADIIGGNSGSPVVNRAGEFVGIIFDGNIQSLVLDFTYEEKQARAVSVNSQVIIEALNKVYDAGPLANELLGAK